MDGIATLLYIVLMLVTVVSAIVYVINRVGAAKHYRQFKKTQKPVRELTGDERNLLEVHYSQRLRDNGVYQLDGAAKVMTLTANGSTERHLSIDGVDIRMFPHWEAIAEAGVNRALVAIPKRAQALLPLEFNGVNLAEILKQSGDSEQSGDAGDESAAAATGVIGSRMETQAEATLRQIRPSGNAGWCAGLFASLLLVLLASRMADPAPVMMLMVLVPGTTLCLASLWQLLRNWGTPRPRQPGKLHTVSGELSEPHVAPTPAISMRFAAARIGATDAYYPKRWLPLIKQQPDSHHRVEIDMKHRVVRHDNLSLYDILRDHPQPRWGRYLVMVLGSAALLGLALLFEPAPFDTLTVASRQLDGLTRQLEASTPAALLAHNPQPGDWVSLTGAFSCMAPVTFQNNPIDDVDHGDRLHCIRLGWNNVPLHPGKLELATQEAALVGLLHQLRADHRLFEYDHPYEQPFAARGDKTGTFVLQDLDRLLLALDSVCHSGGLTCSDIEQHMTRLVATDSQWPALLARAQQGNLPEQVTINRQQLSDLGDFLYTVLRYRVRSAALRHQYESILADYTPALVLQHMDHGFRFSAGSYGEGPFTRQVTSLASAYLSAATRQRMAAYERRQRMKRIRQRRRNPRSTVQKLMNLDIDFRGRIRGIGTYHGRPMLTLEYNGDFEPPSLFHLATAPLMVLFAALAGPFGLIGLIVTRRRKAQRDAAVRKYIEKRLQRTTQ